MPYPIRTLAVMVLHSSRFLVLSMISTSLIFNSWLRLFMKFSRGLPLLLSPSIFPVTTMFSSPCFLMICPRKLICPALILFINFLSVLPLFNTSSFVNISIHMYEMLSSHVPMASSFSCSIHTRRPVHFCGHPSTALEGASHPYLNSVTCGSKADCINTLSVGVHFRHALHTFNPLFSKASHTASVPRPTRVLGVLPRTA